MLKNTFRKHRGTVTKKIVQTLHLKPHKSSGQTSIALRRQQTSMERQGWKDWVSRTHWAPNLHCPLVGSCHVTPDISESMLSNTYVTMVRAEKALTQQKTPLLSTYQLITRIRMLMIILALQLAGISLKPWTLFWVIVVNFLFPLSGATSFWSFFRPSGATTAEWQHKFKHLFPTLARWTLSINRPSGWS